MQGRRQSIPKSEGDGLQTMKVWRYSMLPEIFFKFWYTETALPAFWKHL